jgi:hypothetical protein
MSDTTDDTTAAAQQIDDFGSMAARQVTIHQWRVLSYGGDDLTGYEVNTLDMTCTCGDQQHNNEGGEICKHLAKALYVAEARMEVGEALRYNLTEHAQNIRHEADRLAQAATTAEANAAASGGKETVEEANESVAPEPEPVDTEAAENAAEQLQDAFDTAVDDMQVETGGGAVFFQTGRDTPDDWPYPGGSDTFDVLTDSDHVMYVHDGTADWADSPHKYYDDKPGEWFKNALDPEDIGDYIAEVLE